MTYISEAILPEPPVGDRPFWRLASVFGPTECWPWRGYVNEHGYGKHSPAVGRNARAHRYAYELFYGPIPPGYDIDHVCHTADESCSGGRSCPHRSCVNPTHMRVATRSENLRDARTANRMKTHCPQGHPYEGDNLIINTKGRRECRICRTEASRRFKQRRRAAA